MKIHSIILPSFLLNNFTSRRIQLIQARNENSFKVCSYNKRVFCVQRYSQSFAWVWPWGQNSITDREKQSFLILTINVVNKVQKTDWIKKRERRLEKWDCFEAFFNNLRKWKKKLSYRTHWHTYRQTNGRTDKVMCGGRFVPKNYV